MPVTGLIGVIADRCTDNRAARCGFRSASFKSSGKLRKHEIKATLLQPNADGTWSSDCAAD
jgi:hypothetical protein